MPFFEQNIKVGLVCLNAQMKKNTEAERKKVHQEGRPINSHLGNMSLIMHPLPDPPLGSPQVNICIYQSTNEIVSLPLIRGLQV